MELKYNRDLKEKSPIGQLRHFKCFVEEKGRPLAFEYSIYENGIAEQTKSREIEMVSNISEFYRGLDRCINRLHPNKELAIHSKVRVGDKIMHLPFIDFCIPAKGNHDAQLFNVIAELQDYYNFDIYLFKSGRSFHGYLDVLLDRRQWIQFLGRLLLLNRKDEESIDARWVGHALGQGFCSLRISCNTTKYLSYPEFLAKIPKNK